MKLMIASDIHGSKRYASQLMDAFNREAPDTLVLLGDLLYHGPRNPLPEGYDPQGVLELLNAVKDKIVAVRGNCDSEVDQMVLQFPMMADYALIEADGRRLFLTHGHKFSPDSPPPMPAGALLFNGHTHIPAFEPRGAFTYVNPGSVSLPHQNSQRGYMVLEPGALRHRQLDGALIADHSC